MPIKKFEQVRWKKRFVFQCILLSFCDVLFCIRKL